MASWHPAVLWLLLFFLVPFLIVLKISLLRGAAGDAAVRAALEWTRRPRLRSGCTSTNYAFLFTDSLYISAYLYSLKVAVVSTLLLPAASAIRWPTASRARRPDRRNVLLMLVVLPFWTSFLLRVYAWIGLLKNNGVINNVLL